VAKGKGISQSSFQDDQVDQDDLRVQTDHHAEGRVEDEVRERPTEHRLLRVVRVPLRQAEQESGASVSMGAGEDLTQKERQRAP
jgi:hypothetical protein